MGTSLPLQARPKGTWEPCPPPRWHFTAPSLCRQPEDPAGSGRPQAGRAGCPPEQAGPGPAPSPRGVSLPPDPLPGGLPPDPPHLGSIRGRPGTRGGRYRKQDPGWEHGPEEGERAARNPPTHPLGSAEPSGPGAAAPHALRSLAAQQCAHAAADGTAGGDRKLSAQCFLRDSVPSRSFHQSFLVLEALTWDLGRGTCFQSPLLEFTDFRCCSLLLI